MPRISTGGDIATGMGQDLAINGVTIASLVGVDCDHPVWYTSAKIAFQKNTTVSEIWTYDTGSTALVRISTSGANRLAAGNSKYAASLVNDARSSISGLGSLTGSTLGDMDENGNLIIIITGENVRGVRIYDSTGATLYSDTSVFITPYDTPMSFRNGVAMYDTADGWIMRTSTGTLIPNLVTPGVNWSIPCKLASNVTWVLERYGDPNILAVRRADQTSGFIINTNVLTFNPDIREVSAGIVRIAWCTSAGETNTSLQVMDLNLSTGANRTTVGTGLPFVWTDNPPLGLTISQATGSYTETRYFRVRFIEKSGSVILRRSEPSDTLTFIPSGLGAGATITRPTAINEGETHWELEASNDNANFYVIATTAIATATATDTTQPADTYADASAVSEDIGTYLLQPAAKFIIADGDRLIHGGHETDDALKSRVSWTPVFADPGKGNDERLPLASGGDNFVDLDNYEHGGLTGLGQMAVGVFYAYKWRGIWKFTRTGDIQHAYENDCLTKERGALPDSVVAAVDGLGNPCQYFLDNAVGPCSLGAGGLRDIHGLQHVWKQVTTISDGIACRGAYYPDKQQVHWWVALNNEQFPTHKIVLQVNLLSAEGPAHGGITMADGLIGTARAVGIWHETTVEDGIERLRARPFIGLPQGDNVASTEVLQRCDVGDDDNGVAYHARIASKPFIGKGLLNKWGTMRTAILASANSLVKLLVSAVRDYGKETNSAHCTLDPDPTSHEPYVIRDFDNLVMSEARAIQFVFEDDDNPEVSSTDPPAEVDVIHE